VRRLWRRLWGWVADPLVAPLGQALARPRWKPWLALPLGLALVAFDMTGSFGYDTFWARILPLAVTLPVYGFLCGWDRGSLGLRLSPLQGWWWWLKTGLLLGTFVLVVVAVVGGIALSAGMPLPPPVDLATTDWWGWFARSCLQAPLVEEGTYRFALCLPLVALFGRWPALLASGAVFAVLHVLYGVPSPDNFAGGFVFAWAFLASGSLLIPMLLHAAGNLFVIGWQAAYAYVVATWL